MILEATNLIKTYRQGAASIPVLNGLNLTIPSAESVAILGQSGSGKSTLLSLLSGLDLPDQGKIRLLGQSILDMSEKELARYRAKHLGIVFQQFHLIANLTAIENIALPLELQKRTSEQAYAREVLELVGLGHRANHYPSELSGGECQRVAIARAFVVRPNLLLADEPSGNLDSITGTKVMDLIFEMSETLATSIVLVTHNLDLAKRCRRTLTLTNGRLEETL